MSKLFNTPVLGLTLAAIMAAAAVPAMAQTSDDAISVTVSYRDLDIGHAAGAKALYERITAASARACGDASDERDLGRRAAIDQCRSLAIRQAVASVGSPALSAMAGQSADGMRVASR